MCKLVKLSKMEKYVELAAVYKDCSSNFRSKHSTVLVLCLLRNLLEQSLFWPPGVLAEKSEIS